MCTRTSKHSETYFKGGGGARGLISLGHPFMPEIRNTDENAFWPKMKEKFAFNCSVSRTFSIETDPVASWQASLHRNVELQRLYDSVLRVSNT